MVHPSYIYIFIVIILLIDTVYFESFQQYHKEHIMFFMILLKTLEINCIYKYTSYGM